MVNFTMLVKGRARLTKQSLMSLGEFHGATVLDDYADKDTVGVMDELQKAVGFLRVLGENNGTGCARNRVIEQSEKFWGRGDYLYLSDNDVFFTPGWLETLVKLYEAAWVEGFKVVGAGSHPYHPPIDPTHSVGVPNDSHGVFQVHALPLQSMLMKWEVWDKYGPFCKTEPGRVCQSEDVDFTNKIVADGGKIGVVSPALIVNTGITNSFGEKIPGWELVKAQCPPGVICE